MEINLDSFGHLDKAFSKNLTFFDSQDGGILRNIIIYLGWQWANDPFNFGEFDPKIFQEIMGYKGRSIITEKAEKVYQDIHLNLTPDKIDELKNNKDPNRYYWDTKLENALYTLATKNFEISEGYELDNGDKVHKLKSYQILQSIEIRWKKGKRGKSQKTYYFEANKDFLLNLSKYFALIDKDIYVKLRKPNLQTLYTYLCDIRHDKKASKQSNITITPYFGTLKSLTGVNIEKTNICKKKIATKLNTVLKEATHLNASVEWGKQKPSDVAKYQAIIKFDYTQDKESKDIMEKTLIVLFFHSLLALYRDLYNIPEELYRDVKEKQSFWKWIQNHDIDKDRKILKMTTVYYNFFDKVKKNQRGGMDFHQRNITNYYNNIEKIFRFKPIQKIENK